MERAADENSDRKIVKTSKPSEKEEMYVSREIHGNAGAGRADLTRLAMKKTSVEAHLYVHVY